MVTIDRLRWHFGAATIHLIAVAFNDMPLALGVHVIPGILRSLALRDHRPQLLIVRMIGNGCDSEL